MLQKQLAAAVFPGETCLFAPLGDALAAILCGRRQDTGNKSRISTQSGTVRATSLGCIGSCDFYSSLSVFNTPRGSVALDFDDAPRD